MPRKALLFCLPSMTNSSKCDRNSNGASRYWKCKMFLFGLLLCCCFPNYAEAAFTAPASCTSTTWLYQSNKMQNISCVSQTLTEVPKDAKEGSDVFKLDLSNNQITTLAINEFQYFVNLVYLDLSYNQIPNITVDTFSNLTNLQYLSLAGNTLSSLPSGTFTAISVTTLDLSYLNLGSMEKEHFQNLKSLQEVYLSHNNLTTLERHLFDELRLLQKVDLSWNEITYLDNNQVFKGCSDLEIVDLSNNKIADVHQDFLKDVDALTNLSITYLDLSHNLLTSLHETTFEDVPNLEILYLNHNLLNTLERDQFKDVPGLTTLYLNNNELTSLSSGLFRYNSALLFLYLSANQLSTISTSLFDDQTTSIFSVDVSGNPFICNCDVRDYFFSIKYATTKSLASEDSMYCTDTVLAQHVFLDYNDASCSGNLGSACSVTYDCKVRNSQCDNAKCICTDNYYDTNGNTTDGGLCKDKVELGETCISINNMCRADYTQCGTSDTCECQSGYYDNDGTSNTGGECLEQLPLYSSCNESYQCAPSYSECSSNICSCSSGYYDFTNSGQCQGPSSFYSCYPDNASTVEIVFALVKVITTEEECKNFCFEEDVRYYHIEGSNICICGDIDTSRSCCPKVSDVCNTKTFLGPTTGHSEAGINFLHIPRLTAGYSHTFSLTTTLGAIDQTKLKFGDSATMETINASAAIVQHTYTHSGLFWLTASACASTKNVCEDVSLPVRVQVPAENLTTYMTGMSVADVSSDLTTNFFATFLMGQDIDYEWSRTFGGVVTKRQGCKTGWIQHRSSCIKLETTLLPYNSAESACSSDGSLLKIDFLDEMAEIVTALSASSETFYVGAKRVGGVWQWTDGSKTTFSDSDLVDPSLGDCVSLVGSSNQLTSISCSTTAKFVCMSSPVSCPNGGELLNNGYCYVLASTESVSPKNWQDANDYCSSEFGGWLSNVTEATVQAQVTSLLTTAGVSEAWIGLSDKYVEGLYIWADHSSFDFNNPPHLPNISSNSGDCFLATSANSWNSQDCSNIRDFVCQYSLSIQRLTVPNYVMGSADIQIMSGQDLHHVVAMGTFPSAATSSLDLLLFPGLPFSRAGSIRQWNFCSINVVSGNYDISFQVYRPSCSSGSLFQAGCIPTMFSSCSAASHTCTLSTGCSDTEYYCYLSNSCKSMNESCTCNSVSSTACGVYGDVPTYELQSQTSVTITETGENCYRVSEGDITIQEGDIIGLQFPSGQNIVNCENRPTSTDQQTVYNGTSGNWLVKNDRFPNTYSTVQLTCDLQVVYTQDSVQNLPTNIGYSSSVGDYQLAIAIIETETKQLSVSLEEVIADVTFVFPVLSIASATTGSLGTVYTEWNKAYDFTVAVGRGTSLISKWSFDTSQSLVFTDSCIAAVALAVGDNCNSTLYWSDKPFSTFNYNTSSVGTMDAEIEIKNSLSSEKHTLTIQTEKKISGAAFSLLTPNLIANNVETNSQAHFEMTVTEGTGLSYSFTVGGSSALSINASLFYTFPSKGTFAVTGTVSNILDSQTKSITVYAKKSASFTNCQLLDTPYIAAVGINFALKLQCDVDVGAEVSALWMFSDGSANISSAVSTVSSSPVPWTQLVTFGSVSTVTVTAFAQDPFRAVSVDGTVNVYNALPSVSLIMNSTDVFLNTVIEFTASVPASPGSYGNVTYEVDFGDGTTESTTSGTVTHSYSTGGNKTVSVSASNGPSTVTVTSYVAVYEEVTGLSLTYNGPKEKSQAVVFTASATTGNLLSYRFVSSNSAFDVTQSSPTYTHTFSSASDYNVTVTVSNLLSQQTESITAYVMNAADLTISGFEMDGSVVSNCVETTIGRLFEVNIIHYSVATVTCDWDFGDGSTAAVATTCSKTHAFSSAGNYTINVTAKYAPQNAKQSISQEICLHERITSPTISITTPVTLPSSGKVSENVSVVVSSGAPLTYAWSTNATGGTSTGDIYAIEFTSEGTYTISVTVSNEVNTETVTKTVTVMEEITGVTISCANCLEKSDEFYVQNNTAYTFTVDSSTGSGITFSWNFGDSTTASGISNTHTYTSIGTQNLTITGSSAVTASIVKHVTIHVEATITSVTVSDRLWDWVTDIRNTTLKDLDITKAGKFQATIIPNGMDLEYIWRYESGLSEETTMTNEGEHTFTSTGLKSCTVTAKNSLGNVTSEPFLFYVLEKLTDSTLQVTESGNSLSGTNESNTYKMALNEVAILTVMSAQVVPDTVEYFLRLGKQNPATMNYALQNSTIDKGDPSLYFNLTQSSIYRLQTTIKNSLGSAEATVYVEAIQAISGPYINPPAGKDGNITLGSSLTLTGGATDGEYPEYNWFYASAPVGQTLPTTTTSSISVTPGEVGLYIVTLEVYNSVSSPLTVNFTINVMDGVSGVGIDVTMTYADAVKVGSSLLFLGTVTSGTDLSYSWDAMISGLSDSTGSAQTFTYLFSTQALYNITLFVENYASSGIAYKEIYSLNEVPGFQITVTGATYEASIDKYVARTNTIVTFTSNITNTDFIQFDWKVDGSTEAATETFPQNFTSASQYAVELFASNLISSKNNGISVVIQQPISAFTIQNCMGTYLMNTVITLTASYNGTDIDVEWTREQSSGSIKSIATTVQYSAIGTYSVNVTGSNLVSEEVRICWITIQGAVANLKLTASQYKYVGYPITFTVTGDYVNPASFTWVFSHGVTNNTSNDATLDLTLSSKGNYTLEVTVANDVSSSKVSITFEVEELGCSAPTVTVDGSTERQALRARAVEISVDVLTNGCTYYSSVNSWTIYSASSCVAALTNEYSLPSTIQTNTPSLLLPGNTLSYGTYCVVFKHSYENTPVEDYRYINLTSVASPVKALLKGGHERGASEGSSLTLDASESYDPDDIAGTTLIYTWSCSETMGTTSAADVCSFINAMGTSYATLTGLTLTPADEYTVSLTVSAAGRTSSSTTQMVKIVTATTPVVSIKCVSCDANGHFYLTSSRSVAFEGTCSSGCTSSVTYEWSVTETATGTVVTVDSTQTTTGTDQENFVLLDSVLEDNKEYTFTLEATVGTETGQAVLTLQPSSKPSAGSCTITPSSSIIPLFSLVKFSCTNVVDTDTLSTIYYKITVKSTTTYMTPYIAYYGTKAENSLYLTPFPGTSYSSVDVEIKAINDYRAENDGYQRTISFGSPTLLSSQNNTVDYIVDQMVTSMKTIVKQNNPPLLLQYCMAVLSYLNDQSQNSVGTPAQRMAVRDVIASALSGLPLNSVYNIQQMASAVEYLVEYPDEISLETLTKALEEIETMTEQLASTVSKGDDQRDYESENLIDANAKVQQSLKKLTPVSGDSVTVAKFGNLSNYVLQVSSSAQSVTYSSEEEQTQALIIKSVEFTTDLMIIQLKTTVADEKPVEKSTSEYEVIAQHVSTDRITDKHHSNLGLSLSVPKDILTSHTTYSESSVFQFIYISSINQYDFGLSDVTPLNTVTLSTSFHRTSGDSVSVSNLPAGEELTMYLFSEDVTTYAINDTGLRYSSGYNPLLKMDYSSRTLEADKTFGVKVNMPSEAGVGVHVQVRGNLTRSVTKLKATLYKNGAAYKMSNSDENKRPKTVTKSMMDNQQHDHTDYTFYISPDDYGNSDAFEVQVKVTESTDVNIGVYFTKCEFFNEALSQWDNEGCTPMAESIASVIKCACNHMTSFGGSLFVSPDELDFTDLSNIDIASNPVAIITCSVILGLYIILVIAFRKLDVMDLKRISLIPLCGKDGSHKYEVTIVTGRLPGAGTTAHVGIRLFGEYGKSSRQHVIKAGAFKRNCSDTFIIAYDVNLGELRKIQIWHDNRGTSPSWYLSHVIVNDLQTEQKFYFFGNTWLSLEVENGSIQKELKVAGSHELSKFSHRLKTAMFNSLADKHLWLSLFNHPAQSRFTRVQRVTCCVTILFTFVVVNAMWYGLLKKDNTELGFEGFGWEEVVLALVCNIMVLPVNIGLVFLFKKSRSKPNFFDHVHKPQTAQTLEIENLCGNSQGGSFESTNTGAIPYDLERESTIDSVPRTALGLHRSRHVAKTHRENTDDSILQKRPAVAVTNASSKSPLWNDDNIMKWPDSVTFDDGTDSRPSTASTMAAGPSVRQPPVKAGGSTPGATRKSKTIQKGDAVQLLEELDKLESDLKETESRSVKSSGSKKSTTSLRRPTMHKSHWGSLEDILQSDDESVAESSGKMKKRGSTTSQTSTRKFNPRSDPRINGNGGMWPKSRESVMSGESTESQRTGRGLTSGLRPGYYSELTMESRDIRIHHHKEKCTLPPWCIYIAYILCALLVVFSVIIVILYCFKFGYQESLKWVLALILSLILSFLVIEPLKALLIAVYVVAMFKNVEQDEDEDFIEIEPTFDNSNEKIKDVKFKPISGFALLQAQEEGRKIHRMNVMIRQFIAYIFYLWLIMVIVYVNFRYDTYLMTKHVENDFITPTTNDHLNFTNITTIDEFWDWTETVLVDSLYKENSSQDEEHAFLLGEARMRLIRGITAKCQAANAASGLGASSLTERTCYGQGNYDEDTSDYSEGWNDSNSNYSWRHYSASELGSTHKIGHVATYGGGGYPQGLGTSSAETDSIIAYLKDKGWIDLQTRAIIFEFALYSAGSDVTSMVALLAEFPLTGGVITSYEIQSQNLLWFQENTVDPLMVLECILFLVIVYSVVHLALQIRERGKQFFKDVWNWYEMLTTLMALVSVGMYIGCVVEATNAFDRFLENQTGFTNYERAMYVHIGMRYLHAWLLFLLMFKVVKQLRFIKFMYVYEQTLSKAVGHLLGTGLIYIILLLVYAQVGYLMYGRIVSGFESVGHSITTLIVMIRGTFDFWPMLDHQPVFSHFYVYSYYAFAYGIMIALVISILTSTYKVTKSQKYYKATLEMQDYEMIDFMLKRLKLLTGLQKPKPAFRRVRFPGLPSVSSRSSSSYSNRSSSSLQSAQSMTGQQFSEVQLRSMMARMVPSWQAVLRRMDKIVALDDEEENLVKKAENEMKDLNWKCRVNELERQHKELLSWKNQPSTSDKPPMGDTKQRQSILKRPGASKDNQDRKAPATVSGAPSRTAASTPANDNSDEKGRRPLSDQGVRVEQASTSKRRASSNDKSKLQTFFKSIKPSKSAWNK